jgi:monoamine oxidase
VILLSRKDKCKELMIKFFGPATANMVDSMSEEECVDKCRKRVETFLGEEAGKNFDNI